MTIHEIVTGVVEQRNAKGILVDGEWRNVSKFAPVELPPIGETVRLAVDNKNFIVSLEVVEDSARSSHAVTTSREQTITRLAVLKAAALFGASRPDLKSSDVLRIADLWLEWVGQA